MSVSPVFAAIDLGTNSTRLLIARMNGSGVDTKIETLERQMQITRLGQGVNDSKALHVDAIERTLAVLRGYGEVLARYDVQAIRATATSAARDASNRDALFVPAAEILGVELELLSGDEEARMSFRGATMDLDLPGPYLVIDIGGGSTEMIVGTAEPQNLRSLDIGCVRVTEQYLHSDPPAPEELSAAISVVRDLVADVLREFPSMRQANTIIGLAGTVSTVAAMDQGLTTYDRDKIHGYLLTRAVIEETFRVLAIETIEQRCHNPGLEPGRADVIVGGIAVLAAIMRVLEADEMVVSEADILDGLICSMVESSSN